MAFDYNEAFNRNIGWVSEWEQQILRSRKIAIAGMGGVGGVHLLTLARLGIGAFHIADFDRFETANFNRQVGATASTLGRPKVDVLAEMASDINPELAIRKFPDGVSADNLDAFLDGVDLFVDGLDFFAVEIRRQVFARCHDRGIPAITAAPVGMGAAYLVFMPGRMSFERYFRLDGLPPERQSVNLLLGLTPGLLQRSYLVDPSRVDLAAQRTPSTFIGCQLCAGAAAAEALKILLNRGRVRAAPWYHQFDAYRGRWIRRILWGGNAHPLQRLRIAIAARLARRMSERARAAAPAAAASAGSELEQIVDLARWAPSGDNAQPWRFRTVGDAGLAVEIAIARDNVYEYRDGEPTLLSAGCLIESLRVAASRFGRALRWHIAEDREDCLRLRIDLPRDASVRPDPLLPFLTLRSVDRRPFRAQPLTLAQKAELAAAFGDEFQIEWRETLPARWRMSRLNAQATDVRLRSREAFRVHRQILDWRPIDSPEGVPVRAIGLDPLAIRIMRWAMRDWRRMDRLNRLPGGTLLARLQMDLLPGVLSAAHFTVRRTRLADAGSKAAALWAGQAIQRFWLAATQLGLAVQPGLAPLCFAWHGRRDMPFADEADLDSKVRVLKQNADAVLGTLDDVVFAGRIGYPQSAGPKPRSVRRPLAALLSGAPERIVAEPAQAEEQAELV